VRPGIIITPGKSGIAEGEPDAMPIDRRLGANNVPQDSIQNAAV
jgi:hypothetical protein